MIDDEQEPSEMKIGGLPAVLFHGTSDGYLDSILRDGLLPDCSYKGYLCYADDIEISRHHAEFMAVWDADYVRRACNPVIFRLPIERFDPSGFCVDQNFIVLGPSAGRAVHRDLSRSKMGWRALLKLAGAVGYRCTVRVTKADMVSMKPRMAAA